MRNFIVSITTFIIIGALTKSMAITWPLNTTDELSSAFGPRNLHPTAEFGEQGYDYDFHAGIDIGGTGDVKAIESGTVVKTAYNLGQNSYFVVQSQQHSDWIMYLHVYNGPDESETVSEGDFICKVYSDHIDIRYFYIPQYYDPQYDTPPYEREAEIRYNLTFHPMILFDYDNGNANYEVDFEDDGDGPLLGDDDKGKYLTMFGRVDDDELDLCDVEMEISNHEGDETTTYLLRGHTYEEVYVDYNWRTNCGDLYGIDSDDGDMNSNIRIIPRIFSGGSGGEDPYHTVYFRFYVDDTIIPSPVSAIDGTVFAAEVYYMSLDYDDYTIYYGDGWISTSYANVLVGNCPPYCGENYEPYPPINVAAVAEPNTDMSVKITWDHDYSGPSADYYLIYRRPDGTPQDNFECIGNAVYLTFRDVTGSPGKAYIYAVAGVNEIGEGMNSNDVTVTMPSYGTITSQRIWKGVFVITNDVVVNSNAVLTVMPGSTVKFNTGIKLRVLGTLAAEGRDFNPITFTRSGSSGSWYGIKFENSSVDANCIIKYADIEYADYGIYCYQASPKIEYSTISNCTYGLRAYYSSPTVLHNTISGNSSYGVYLYGSSPKLRYNVIKNHSGSSDAGVYASTGSHPEFGWGGYRGRNVIKNNYYGIVANSSNPCLGLGDCGEWGGYNSVYDNSNKNVVALNYSEVAAELTWWDETTESAIRATFDVEEESLVRVVPYLESDPNSGMGKSIGGAGANLIAGLPFSPEYDEQLAQGGLKELNLSLLDENQLLWYASALFHIGEYDRAKSAAYRFIGSYPEAGSIPIAFRFLYYIHNATQSAEIEHYLEGLLSPRASGFENIARLNLAMIKDKPGSEREALTLLNDIMSSAQDDWITAEAYLMASVINLIGLQDTTTASSIYQAYKQKFGGRYALEAIPEFEDDMDQWAAKYIVPESTSTDLPSEFSLSANFPNPFNPATTISYALPDDGTIVFTVYDLQGRVIYSLSRSQARGFHTLRWEGCDSKGFPVGSGVYFYVVRFGENVAKGKMLLLK